MDDLHLTSDGLDPYSQSAIDDAIVPISWSEPRHLSANTSNGSNASNLTNLTNSSNSTANASSNTTATTTAVLPCPLPLPVPNSSSQICTNLATGVATVPYLGSCVPGCVPGFTGDPPELNCSTGILQPSTFTCIAVASCLLLGDPVSSDGDNKCAEGGRTVLSGAVCTANCKKLHVATPLTLSCFNGTLTPDTFTCREQYVIPPPAVATAEQQTPPSTDIIGIIIGAICGTLLLLGILVLVRYALVWRRDKWTRDKKAKSPFSLFELAPAPDKSKLEFRVLGQAQVVPPKMIALSDEHDGPSHATNEKHPRRQGDVLAKAQAPSPNASGIASPKPKLAPKMKPAVRRKGGRI